MYQPDHRSPRGKRSPAPTPTSCPTDLASQTTPRLEPPVHLSRELIADPRLWPVDKLLIAELTFRYPGTPFKATNPDLARAIGVSACCVSRSLQRLHRLGRLRLRRGRGRHRRIQLSP